MPRMLSWTDTWTLTFRHDKHSAETVEEIWSKFSLAGICAIVNKAQEWVINRLKPSGNSMHRFALI
jgi:hypothetical protein